MKNLALLIVLAVGGYALAQENAGPEAAMLRYADAAKSFDAERIARLMHPEALQRFRDAFDAALLGENGDRARTELLPLFAVSTYDEFQALSNVEAFQRLNEAVSRAAPELAAVMANSEYEIIGTAQRGDEVFLTYVLTVAIEGRPVKREAAQRLKQHDGEWLLMLPPNGEATIAGLEARY